DVDKESLALAAALDNTPGGLHVRTLAFGSIGGQSANINDRLVSIEAPAPRVEPQLLDLAQLINAAGFQCFCRFGHFGRLSFRGKQAKKAGSLLRRGF